MTLMLATAVLAGCGSSPEVFTWETGAEPVRADVVDFGIDPERRQSSLAPVRATLIFPDRREHTIEADRVWFIHDANASGVPDDRLVWLDFKWDRVSGAEATDVLAIAAEQVGVSLDRRGFGEWVAVDHDDKPPFGFTAHLDDELRYRIDVGVVPRRNDVYEISIGVSFLDDGDRADPLLTEVTAQDAWRNR